MTYLMIKNVQTHGFNCEQNAMVVADTPSIPAIMGFVHALFRDIPGLTHRGVAVIYHDTLMRPGIEKHLIEAHGERANASRAASIKEKITGDSDMTLIIQFDNDDDDDELEDCLPNIVSELLVNKRIAGGVVPYLPPQNIRVVSEEIEDIKKEMLTVSPGHFLIDCTDMLMVQDATPMEVLSDYVGWHKFDGETKRQRMFRGNFVPTAIGYAGIEKPVVRDTRIGPNETVLVEGITGLGLFLRMSPFETKSFFCINRLDITVNRSSVFWSMEFSSQNQTYLCRGNRKGI